MCLKTVDFVGKYVNNSCSIARLGEFKDHPRLDISVYLSTERTVKVCHPLYKLKYPSICKM